MGRVPFDNPIYDMLYKRGIYEIDEIKEKSMSFFKRYIEIGEVYLVGSYSKGYACETSDIDFMVFFNKGLKYHNSKKIKISNGKIEWWRGFIDAQVAFEKQTDLFDGDIIKMCRIEDYKEFMKNSILVYRKKGFIPNITNQNIRTKYICIDLK